MGSPVPPTDPPPVPAARRRRRRWRRLWPALRGSNLIIGCQAAREAISALVDGESPPVSEAVTKTHLANCPGCRQFQANVVSLRRHMSVRVLAPIPDRTTEILASLALPSHPMGARARPWAYRRRIPWMRATQWAAGVLPLGIAVPALALGAFTHTDLIGSHVLSPCTSFLVHHHLGG